MLRREKEVGIGNVGRRGNRHVLMLMMTMIMKIIMMVLNMIMMMKLMIKIMRMRIFIFE